MNKTDELIQSLILNNLKNKPEGMTEKEIYKVVKKDLKQILYLKKLYTKQEKISKKIEKTIDKIIKK